MGLNNEEMFLYSSEDVKSLEYMVETEEPEQELAQSMKLLSFL